MKDFLFESKIAKAVLSALKDQRKSAKYCTTKFTSVHFIIKRPVEYTYGKKVYELIKELDETERVPPVDSFEGMNYMNFTVNVGLVELTVRHYELPFFTVGNFHLGCAVVAASFCSPVLILLYS